jgi:predicted CxxxxCH...CXXCH cytochrome family protein
MSQKTSPGAMQTLAACLVLLASCGEVRAPIPGRESPTATYIDHVRPILESRCVSCHSGSSPAGSYDLSTHLSTLGHGSDGTRNVLPGDKESILLTRLDPAKDAQHHAYLLPTAQQLGEGETATQRQADDYARLVSWVVKARAAYQDSSVHPAGWLDPSLRSAATFHGGYLRKKAWKTTECQSCHGAALTGGAREDVLAGGSCASCHSGGTGSCDTCHGDGSAGSTFKDLSGNISRSAAGAGAHAAHLKASAANQWLSPKCDDCHKVPKTTDAEGHLGSDLHAEVHFSDRASGKLYAGGKGPAAAYDATTGTCTNVHCHGLNGGSVTAWKWTDTQKMTCDACHGTPPKEVKAGFDHPQATDCLSCHPSAYDPSKHINGKVEL